MPLLPKNCDQEFAIFSKYSIAVIGTKKLITLCNYAVFRYDEVEYTWIFNIYPIRYLTYIMHLFNAVSSIDDVMLM